MMYELGTKYILDGVECTVAFIDNRGKAYVTPDADSEDTGHKRLLKGVVFAKLDKHGFDTKGNRAVPVMPECLAV